MTDSAQHNGQAPSFSSGMTKLDEATQIVLSYQKHAEATDGAPTRARVLSIEGSDPIGGAGTMADMKAFTAHGVFGYAAMTCVCAQNTQGVTDIVNMEPDFLRAQLDSVADDGQIDSMKIGMLGTTDIVDCVRDWLDELLTDYRRRGLPKPWVVIDPVMYAKSGDSLLTPDAEQELRTILPYADVITPNVPELAALAHASALPTTWSDAVAMAGSVADELGVIVYAKAGMFALNETETAGSHAASHRDAATTGTGSHPAPECNDALVFPAPDSTVVTLTGRRVNTVNVHGTGDSLSSSLAALRPQFTSWQETAQAAKDWMTGAIAAADGLHVGKGHGPIDFTWMAPPTSRTFSDDYWMRTRDLRGTIGSMPFIQRLLDGTLNLDDFSFYLHQDDLYLTDYSSLLALASSRADTLHDRVFFAQCASEGVEAEVSFHAEWFRSHGYSPKAQPMSTVTAAYIGHEHHVADHGNYAELAAVLLPCFWLYGAIGMEIAQRAADMHIDLATHPFGTWIGLYSDTSFNTSVAGAIAICNRLARQGSRANYDAMMEAALISSDHEYRFFNQGIDRPGLVL